MAHFFVRTEALLSQNRGSLAAHGLFYEICLWSSEVGTDGAIPRSAVAAMAPGEVVGPLLAELIHSGFLSETADGYQVSRDVVAWGG